MDLAVDGMAFARKAERSWHADGSDIHAGRHAILPGQFADARACYENALTAYDDRDRTKFWTAFTGHDAGVTHRLLPGN